MYIDQQMLRIIAKSMGYTQSMSNEFIEQHANNMSELVYMKILNYYAANHTEEENKALQDLMHEVAKIGKVEDQKKITQLMQQTLLESPELMAQIRQQQNEFHTQMFFDFMANSSELLKMELLKYMVQTTNIMQKARIVIDKFEEENKDLN